MNTPSQPIHLRYLTQTSGKLIGSGKYIGFRFKLIYLFSNGFPTYINHSRWHRCLCGRRVGGNWSTRCKPTCPDLVTTWPSHIPTLGIEPRSQRGEPVTTAPVGQFEVLLWYSKITLIGSPSVLKKLFRLSCFIDCFSIQ